MDPKTYLHKATKRCIATILGFSDEYCKEYLPSDVAEDLRTVVMEEINRFYHCTLDVLNSIQPGDEAEKVGAIYDAVI
jgi:hypothetical protein